MMKKVLGFLSVMFFGKVDFEAEQKMYEEEEMMMLREEWSVNIGWQ